MINEDIITTTRKGLPRVDMPEQKPRLKIYGERNTGTTFLRELMKRNFAVSMLSGTPWAREGHDARDKVADEFQHHPSWTKKLVRDRFSDLINRKHMNDTLGWKHMYPPISILKNAPELTRNTIFMVTAKHPVFWALSFHRHPYHHYFKTDNMTFADFIRHPFIPMISDNVDVPYYKSIIELYGAKVDGYRELASLDLTMELVRYENLVANVMGFLDEMTAKYGLARRSKEPAILGRSTKGDARTLADFQTAYKVENAMKAVSEEDYRFIISVFGRRRLAWLGYAEE